MLAVLGRQEALSKSFLEAAGEAACARSLLGQQETVWGLANGLTQASQALSPDDRYADRGTGGPADRARPAPASRPCRADGNSAV